MPEGDTLYRVAATLKKAMVGRTIIRFDTSLEAVAYVDARTPVAGRVVSGVDALGKHLLIVLRKPDSPGDVITVPPSFGLELYSLDLVLHTHLRMTGSWHVYRHGEIWQKPANYSRVVLYTDEFIFPCFSAPVVELLTAREATRHPQLTSRGPDAMTDDFDPDQARARLRLRAELPIGVAIMDQKAMAGVGNVYKSEVLFIRRVSPFTPVQELSDEVLDGIIAESHKLLVLNRNNTVRRTNFGLAQSERLWAYGRSGSPCRVCGTLIKMRRQGVDGRSTYYCPSCQHVTHT
jgi:endonuclease-8